MKQMNLLDWNPPCQVVAFPLINRVGRIREVAEKLNAKSLAAANFYERQVTEGLLAHLDRLGVDEAEQDRQIACFWDEVCHEAVMPPAPRRRRGMTSLQSIKPAAAEPAPLHMRRYFELEYQAEKPIERDGNDNNDPDCHQVCGDGPFRDEEEQRKDHKPGGDHRSLKEDAPNGLPEYPFDAFETGSDFILIGHIGQRLARLLEGRMIVPSRKRHGAALPLSSTLQTIPANDRPQQPAAPGGDVA
jgi:hypothetical protein